jgi:hypothetical protein
MKERWKRGRRSSNEKVLQDMKVMRANAAKNMAATFNSRCGALDFFVGVAVAEEELSAAAVPEEPEV